jgi:hypothetical protein
MNIAWVMTSLASISSCSCKVAHSTELRTQCWFEAQIFMRVPTYTLLTRDVKTSHIAPVAVRRMRYACFICSWWSRTFVSGWSDFDSGFSSSPPWSHSRWGPPVHLPLEYGGGGALFLVVKRLEVVADLSPASIAEVRIAWSFTHVSYTPSWLEI